ncbi:hypothetical protein BDP27DRAFT_1451915 [Rhodocollybia butyracea]|uniref:F-box domain-containing protein n=1 Tax=Rhodocollybia butyracea TaxID=206335 RepID=A0A9P5TZY5_9AGAR|nr:hypothetical protein BDP27DRAFT_1451915 [Rhodocollybia butyracea]
MSSTTSLSHLPVELHEKILDIALTSNANATTMSDALNFALVSKLWTPRSRYHLHLSLDESRVKYQKLRTFTNLCEHPLSTLTLIRALSISNVGNIRIGLKRSSLDHTAANALFSRRFLTKSKSNSKSRDFILESVFTHLKTLTLEKVGWWTLSDAARSSLHNGFQLVTSLALHNVSFLNYHHFHELVCSFPTLETLHVSLLQSSFIPDHEKNPNLQLPVNLHSIEIATVDAATLTALSFLTPCRRSADSTGRPSAGSSLVDLTLAFSVDTSSNDIRIRKPSFEIAIAQFKRFHNSIDLSKNPSLKSLTLDIRPDPYLVLFLQHALHPTQILSIRSLSIPYLENIIFSLKTQNLPNDGLTESDLDIGLQQLPLANVQELNFEVMGYFPRATVIESVGKILGGFLERGVVLVTSCPMSAINIPEP